MSKKSATRSQNRSAHRNSPSGRIGQVSPTKSKPAPKVHGGWLTAMLILIALHGVLTTVLLLVYKKQEYMVAAPPWLLGAAILVGVADIGAAVALWYWQKWGLYLYVVSSLVAVALGVMIMPLMVAAFHALIPLALLGMILTSQRKMQQLV